MKRAKAMWGWTRGMVVVMMVVVAMVATMGLVSPTKAQQQDTLEQPSDAPIEQQRPRTHVRAHARANALQDSVGVGASSAQCDAKAEIPTELVGEIMPAPPSIGADVPASYFGTAPSTVQKELIGPYQLMKSGTVNLDKGTITLPLYEGYLKADPNTRIWYVLTDTSDAENAAALGLNFAAKLRFAAGRAVRTAEIVKGKLAFGPGTVDFAPRHKLVPGKAPSFFPPSDFQPGSVGDRNYSPLVKIVNNGFIFNAPIVAAPMRAGQFNRMWCKQDVTDPQARRVLHDKVVRFCPGQNGSVGTVELMLTSGHSFARPVLYLSTEANTKLAATLESATMAPGMDDLVIGGDDSFISPVERLFSVTNGYTNGDINSQGLRNGPGETVHPSRQGLNSLCRGDGTPLNVLGGIPTVATDYSPMWDVNICEWTPYALANNYRVRLLEEFQILGLVVRGFLTGPGGADFGSSGNIVNCPIVYRFL
jgi:hypothetical protein